MGKSGDTECPPCESQKLVEEGKESLRPRNGAGSGGYVMAALAHEGAAMYQSIPSCTWGAARKRWCSDFFAMCFFVWQPNLCKKQVLKIAVVCAQAPVWLGTCTSVYVEACVYGIGLYCLVGLCHQSPVTVVSQKQLLHCEDPKVMHRFVPAAFWEPLVGLLRGSLIPFCCHYQDLHMRDLQEKRKG